MFSDKKSQNEYYLRLRSVQNIKFTERQVDVLACIANGRVKHQQISDILGIEVTVVSSHLVAIRQRINQNPGLGNDILSFIEQAPNYLQIKNHYSFLMKCKKFQALLKTIHHKIKKLEAQNVIVFYSDINDRKFFLGNTRFGLTTHLSFLGINTEECNISDYSKISKVKGLLDNSRIVFILSESFVNKVSSEFHRKSLDMLLKNLLLVNSRIILLKTNNPEKLEKHNNLLQMFKNPTIIDYGKNFKGFISLLMALEVITSNEKDRYIEELKSDEWQLITTKHNVEYAKEDSKILVKNSIKFKALGSLLFMALFFIILFVIKEKTTEVKDVFSTRSNEVLIKQNREWNIPNETFLFVDRPKIINEVGKLLLGNNKVNSPNIIGLFGLGGVGKTSIAASIINNPKKKYTLRAWFNSESEQILQNNFFELGQKYNLLHNEMSTNKKIEVIKDWINEHEKVMLVYDNVPDMAILEKYLPRKGDIIITSRNYKLPNAIEVDVFTQSQATELINNILSKKNKLYESEIKDLIEALDYIPLALSQAGAYIEQNKLRVRDYLLLYKNQQAKLLSDATMPVLDKHLPTYVTWDMNITQLFNEDGGQNAVRLLKFLSFCYPDNIPKKLLSQYLYNNDDASSTLKLHKTLSLIRKYSLIKQDENSVSIHRIVQSWMKHKINDQHKAKLLKDYIDALKSFYPTSNFKHKTFPVLHQSNLLDFKKNLPQAIYVRSQLETLSLKGLGFALDEILCDIYYLLGEYDKSLEHAKKALTYKQQHIQDNSLEISFSLYKVGVLCHEMSLYVQSIEALERDLKIKEKFLNQIPNELALTLQQLGRTWYEFGDLEKSQDFLQRALVLRKKNLGENHYDTRTSIYYLGLVNFKLGNYVKGRHLLESLVAMDEKELKEINNTNKSTLTKIFFRLGISYGKLGNVKKSKKYLLDCLELRKSISGETLVMVDILNSLGVLHYKLGQHKEGEKFFKNAIKITQKYNKDNHYALYYLGLLYQDKGQYEKSTEFLKKIIDIQEKQYYPDAYHKGYTLFALGKTKYLQGKYFESKDLLVKSLEICKKYFKEDHITIKKVREQLLQTNIMLGKRIP